jgi:hypothetical protein
MGGKRPSKRAFQAVIRGLPTTCHAVHVSGQAVSTNSNVKEKKTSDSVYKLS